MPSKLDKNRIYVCLENIRSLYNVGAVMRTCSFFGFKNLILLGYSGVITNSSLVPGKKALHPKLEKTALGSSADLNIIYLNTTQELLQYLNDKREDYEIYSFEQHKESMDFSKWVSVFSEDVSLNRVLVFGNEKEGISSGMLKESDSIIEISGSRGHNSLNVGVTCGIVLGILTNGL